MKNRHTGVAGQWTAWRQAPSLNSLSRGRGDQPSTLNSYKNIPGFCMSATLEEIRKHNHVLTPVRYVGAAEEEEDGEPFEKKMKRLTTELHAQFADSARPEEAILQNLGRL